MGEVSLAESVLGDENAKNEIEEYWQIILGNVKIIAILTLIVLLWSAVYHSMLPNSYEATATILTERPQSKTRSYDDFIMPAYKEDDYYGTQVAVLVGRKIRERTVEELNLSIPFQMSARRLRGTSILSLTVTCQNPEMAATIANKVASIYVLESVDESLYMSKQVLKLFPEESGGSEEFIPEFNRQQFVESLSGVVGSPEIQRLKTQKIEIESELKELSTRYRPDHPVMKELTERLDFVELTLQERVKAISTNLKVMMKGDVKINTIRVLEEALTPGAPSAPNRPAGIFLHTILGLFGSIILVLAREHTNKKIRTESDLHRHIRIPYLGHIPLTREINKSKKKARKDGYSIMGALNENVMLSDAVASVRTHILFSMPYEKSKRIMFTSVIPSEGKTTAAALLALSLASLNWKILLIDADLRRPAVHTYFNLANQRGLTDYLVGNASMEDVIQDVPNSTLKIITGGNGTPNPTELLSSERCRSLFDDASLQFDRIIVDVPPALYIPDGLVVAKYVHSGILVCGSGMVHKKSVLEVKEKFAATGHAFIGAIINRVNYEKHNYRYHYYKKYKSYYTK